MNTSFFTNRDGNNLLEKFKGVLEYIPDLHSFDALVGYFRSSGYFRLRPFLDNIKEIRILVGINVDQLTEQYSALGQQYLKDSKETKEAFLASLRKDIE
ncbi:MAG: SNF2/RAD54 family helicase, partial [Bacteroidetes bacterium]|nr:SNF2/RAD54 family helicase [Bacteroidota bacterium]